MKTLLTGGISQRNSRLVHGRHILSTAEIGLVDWKTEEFSVIKTYDTPADDRPREINSCTFGCATVDDGLLYTCTPYEVLIYDLETMECKSRITNKYFNDVHHARLIDGRLYVTSTGLDSVIQLDAGGEIASMQNVLGKDLWWRFPEGDDYRKIVSTKPHESHPNFLFDLDGEPWVTRFNQRDAVALNDPSRRIPIDVERVHDGVVYGDHIYFTCVNGNIAVASRHSLKVEEVIDLNEIDDRGQPLGWCRGICVDGDLAYVGFSKLRTTKLIENVQWVKAKLKPGSQEFASLDSRVACYDMRKKELIKEVPIPPDSQSAIFSVVAVDSSAKLGRAN